MHPTVPRNNNSDRPYSRPQEHPFSGHRPDQAAMLGLAWRHTGINPLSHSGSSQTTNKNRTDESKCQQSQEPVNDFRQHSLPDRVPSRTLHDLGRSEDGAAHKPTGEKSLEESCSKSKEGESGDIIDVVSVKEGYNGIPSNAQNNEKYAQDKLSNNQTSEEFHHNVSTPSESDTNGQSQQQHSISTSKKIPTSSMKSNSNVDSGTLDLSLRAQSLATRLTSSPQSTFMPIQADQATYSHGVQSSGDDSQSLPQVPLVSSQNAGHSPAKNAETSRPGITDIASGFPSSNLPPHILAWLLSSRLNPVHRVQVSAYSI